MSMLDAMPAPLRRRWFIAACLVPFALLCQWSALVIRSTRAAHQELDHCTLWTLEAGRHLEAFEVLHQKASSILKASSIAEEMAAVDAASDALGAFLVLERSHRARREAANPGDRLEGGWTRCLIRIPGAGA